MDNAQVKCLNNIVSLILKSISKSFGKKRVIDNFSKSFMEKKAYGIKGANGSGKTTLLKIISGLITPDSGEVSFNQLQETKTISYIDSNTRSFFQRITPMDNLYFYGGLNGISRNKIENTVKNSFMLFDTSTYKTKPVKDHSLGQIQILSFIRGFLCNPSIILLDEIFSALDENNKKNVNDFLSAHTETNNSINIFTSHDSDFLNETCDEIIAL